MVVVAAVVVKVMKALSLAADTAAKAESRVCSRGSNKEGLGEQKRSRLLRGGSS